MANRIWNNLQEQVQGKVQGWRRSESLIVRVHVEDEVTLERKSKRQRIYENNDDNGADAMMEANDQAEGRL